jgi:NADH-quinone oxidoreductase subunit N
VVLASIGIAASVIGAFYYLKVVKVLYFDDATDTVRGLPEPSNTVLLFGSAVFLSPLGYLLTPVLGVYAGMAAAALLHFA